jgi:SpoVK/Ycf46/Vps4 family AAA+-type ATPase
MALNENVRLLMRRVAENNLQASKAVVKHIIENEKSEKNQAFCNQIMTKLNTQALNMLELPANVKGLINVEDVSVSFNENRYFLTESEEQLFGKINAASKVNKQLADLGIRNINSALLYGESGTGKTTFGRYAAYKLGLPFVYMNFSQCVCSLLGNTQKNIEKVFEFVREKDCLFMIDEIDAVGLARGHSSEVGEMSRVVIALMQALDSLGNDKIVIAATNRLDIIDKALIRRFNIQHEVKPLTGSEAIYFVDTFYTDIGSEYSSRPVYDCIGENNKQSYIINLLTQSVINKLMEEVTPE